MIIKSLGLAGALEKKRGNGAVKYKPVPEDFREFAAELKILSTNGVQQFNLYEYQEKLIDSIRRNHTTMVIKGRQQGASESLLAWMLWEALLVPGTTAVFYSLNQQSTSGMAKRMRLMIEGIPQYCGLVGNNLQALTFSNNSSILFRNSSITGSRGIASARIIIFDEAAYIPQIEELYKSVMPATSMVGDKARIVFNSTPAGQSGFYYNRMVANNPVDIMEVIEGIKTGKLEGFQEIVDNNGWAKVVLHWKQHPIYGANENYLIEVAKKFQLDAETVNREFDLSFIADALGVFSADLVRSAFTHEVTRQYDKTKTYYGSVDPASVGQDYFTSLVFEYDDETEVSTCVDWYRARGKTTEVNVSKTWDLFEKYHVKDAVVEQNGVGAPIAEKLNSHRTISFEPLVTSASSKLSNIQSMLMCLESGKLIMPNHNIIKDEALSFSKIGDKLMASSGSHDDTIMAASFYSTLNPYLKHETVYTVPRPKVPVKAVSRFG